MNSVEMTVERKIIKNDTKRGPYYYITLPKIWAEKVRRVRLVISSEKIEVLPIEYVKEGEG